MIAWPPEWFAPSSAGLAVPVVEILMKKAAG
jgi:hypothetical protein